MIVDYVAWGHGMTGEAYYTNVVMGWKENLARAGSIFGTDGAPNCINLVMKYAADMDNVVAGRMLVVAIAFKVSLSLRRNRSC